MANVADDTNAIKALLEAELPAIKTAIEGISGGGGMYQPQDDDLTAISELTTTPYGRALLELIDQAALQTAVGLGTAGQQPSSAFVSSAGTQAYGLALLALASQAALQTAVGLGTAGLRAVGSGGANLPDIDIADARYQAKNAFLTAFANSPPSLFAQGMWPLTTGVQLRAYADIYAGGSATPEKHNLVGWSMAPELVTNTTQLGNGEIWVHKVTATKQATINNLYVAVQTAGSGLTAGQNLAALLSTAGSRLAVTGDLSSVWNSAGNKTLPLSSSYVVQQDTDYYIALLAVGTTPPIVRRINLQNTIIGNFNLTAATARFAKSTGGKTSIPVSNDLSTFVLGDNGVFVAMGT